MILILLLFFGNEKIKADCCRKYYHEKCFHCCVIKTLAVVTRIASHDLLINCTGASVPLSTTA